MNKSTFNVRRMTVSALLLAISLALQATLSFYIPLFGENGMRIGISGIFSMMPSFLFGPVYGALTSGLSDLLGYLLKPTGAYLPLMTLIIAAGGFFRGGLWLVLSKKSGKSLRIIVAVIATLLLALGLCNALFLQADGVNNQFYDTAAGEVNTEGMHPISRMLISRTISAKNPAGNLASLLIVVTWGLIGSGALGYLLLLAEVFISKRVLKDTPAVQLMPMLASMVVSGLVVTTLNTILLRETVYASWKLLPFAVVWLPRVIEEILANTVKAYFVALLLGVFQRQKGLRQLIH